MSWRELLSYLWQNHRGALVGALTGLVVGLLFLVLGFWKTMLIIILVGLGYVIGGRYDQGDQFKNLLDRFFREW